MTRVPFALVVFLCRFPYEQEGMSSELLGKTAIVTGAGSGMGLAIAKPDGGWTAR